MNKTSGFDDMSALWLRLQRQVWGSWTGGAGGGSTGSRDAGVRHSFEQGEEILEACLKLQVDLASAAMRPWCGGMTERTGFDAAREGMGAWLAFQERVMDTWLQALSMTDPARIAPGEGPFGAASAWIDACGKLAEEGFEMQRRLLGGGSSEAKETPAPRKAASAKAAERRAL